jgi:hypothetical protein
MFTLTDNSKKRWKRQAACGRSPPEYQSLLITARSVAGAKADKARKAGNRTRAKYLDVEIL